MVALFHKDKTSRAPHDAKAQPSAPSQASPHAGAQSVSSPQVQSGAETVSLIQNMVTHTGDVFATLRNLLINGSTDSRLTPLITLLSGTNIATWVDAPFVQSNRLARNNRLWLGSRFENVKDEEYDCAISAEAALNLACDMASQNINTSNRDNIVYSARWLLAQTHNLPLLACAPPYYTEGYLAEGLKWPGKFNPWAGEWGCRLGVSELAESVSAPFRVVFDMRTNLQANTMLISVELPRPQCFGFCASVESLQAAIARDYAVRLMLLMARGAFHTNSQLSRVIITGHNRQDPHPILSFDIAPNQLPDLLESVEGSNVDTVLSGQFCKVRCSIGPQGWFQAITPHLSATDPLMLPNCYRQYVELSHDFCSEQLARVSGARLVKDFGINENASRQHIWDEVLQGMEFAEEAATVTQSAGAFSSEFKHFDAEYSDKLMFGLITLQKQTEDTQINLACSRTIKALMEKRVDAHDMQKLKDLFVRGEGLPEAVDFAVAACSSHEEEQIRAAIGVLEGSLTPELQFAYLDDTEAVYRYFNNVAERVYYNVALHDSARQITLVPDEYYQVHEMLAQLYNIMGDGKRALSHCDEIMRIAPASPKAALVKARVLETQGRMFEAADLIKQTISICATARDTALCHYRLAYLQWRLGRNDLSLACYRRAISLKTSIAIPAQTELSELCEKDSLLNQFKDLSDEEVFKMLDNAEIPRGCSQEVIKRTYQTAVLCAEDRLFSIAAPMTAVFSEMYRDDAVYDVFHSFFKPEEFSKH